MHPAIEQLMFLCEKVAVYAYNAVNIATLPDAGRLRLVVSRENEQDVMTLFVEHENADIRDLVAAKLSEVTKLKGAVEVPPLARLRTTARSSPTNVGVKGTDITHCDWGYKLGEGRIKLIAPARHLCWRSRSP